jgi:hypothetical protein
MRADHLQQRSVVIGELLPKTSNSKLTRSIKPKRCTWRNTCRQSSLRRGSSKTIDAPSWLWNSIVELVGSHEIGYFDHCRLSALAATCPRHLQLEFARQAHGRGERAERHATEGANASGTICPVTHLIRRRPGVSRTKEL